LYYKLYSKQKSQIPPQTKKNNQKRPNQAVEPHEAIPLPERRQPAGIQTPSPGRRVRLPLSSSPSNSSPDFFFHSRSRISDPTTTKKEKNNFLM